MGDKLGEDGGIGWIAPNGTFQCVTTRGASPGRAKLVPRYPRLSRSQDSKLVANNHLLRSY